MALPRILFADDEANLRFTLPLILQNQGFDVKVAASVPEALEAIARERFDVLLSDLNIGQPGDGFTVVSAMRRSQPQAITLIITGYPDFETALQAIRDQVDDYVVKPAAIPQLIEMIKSKLVNRRSTLRSLPLKHVCHMLREHKTEVLEAWLGKVCLHQELARIPLSASERCDHVPRLIDELANELEHALPAISPEGENAAMSHGEARQKQGYTVPQIMIEGRILQTAISNMLEANLLALDMSTLISDILKLSEGLNSWLEISIRAYQRCQSNTA